MPQAHAARRSSKGMRYALFLTTMGADQRLEEQHQQHRSHYNRDSSPSRTTKLYRVEADRRGDIKQLYSHAISPYTRMAILCRCYHVKRSLRATARMESTTHISISDTDARPFGLKGSSHQFRRQ